MMATNLFPFGPCCSLLRRPPKTQSTGEPVGPGRRFRIVGVSAAYFFFHLARPRIHLNYDGHYFIPLGGDCQPLRQPFDNPFDYHSMELMAGTQDEAQGKWRVEGSDIGIFIICGGGGSAAERK